MKYYLMVISESGCFVANFEGGTIAECEYKKRYYDDPLFTTDVCSFTKKHGGLFRGVESKTVYHPNKGPYTLKAYSDFLSGIFSN